jgi:hypothetical protein
MGLFEDRDIDLTTEQASDFLTLVWFYVANGMARRAVARNDDAAIQDMLNRLGVSDPLVVNQWMTGINRHRQAFEEVGSYMAMVLCPSRPCHSRLSVEAMRETADGFRSVMARYGDAGM